MLLASEAVLANSFALTPAGSGLTPALLAAALINGIVTFSGGTTAAPTLDTAANIIAAIPNAQVGSSFDLIVQNLNSGAATFTAGPTNGVTVTGTLTLATGTSQMFKGIVTNVLAPAVTLYAVLKTAS
jgi:hypothetical protein